MNKEYREKFSLLNYYTYYKDKWRIGMEEKKIVVAGHVSLDITPKFNMKTKVSSIGSVIKAGKLINVGKAAIAPGC